MGVIQNECDVDRHNSNEAQKSFSALGDKVDGNQKQGQSRNAEGSETTVGLCSRRTPEDRCTSKSTNSLDRRGYLVLGAWSSCQYTFKSPNDWCQTLREDERWHTKKLS